MVRNISSFLIPPFAVCRYGCRSHCAPAVASVWLAGVILLAYHFFSGPHANTLIDSGSLWIGSFLVVMAGIWAVLTLRRVDQEVANQSKHAKWCGLFNDLDNRDPLSDVDRLNRP